MSKRQRLNYPSTHSPDSSTVACCLLTRLNKSIITKFQRAMSKDPTADLTPLLENYIKDYVKRRKEVRETMEPTDVPKLAGSANDFASSPITSLTSTVAISQLSRSQKQLLSVSPDAPITILHPIAPEVRSLLSITEESDLSPNALTLVLGSSKPLYSCSQRLVLQLSCGIVVKINSSNPTQESDILYYVQEHAPSIPVPSPLGVLLVGATSYLFTTLVPGNTAESIWPNLSDVAKLSLQQQLTTHLTTLRQLRPSTPISGLGWDGNCVDNRNQTRAARNILSETTFNDFLLASPLPRISPEFVALLKFHMFDGHSIVMTHADLHPRNIMIHDDGSIAGLLDWENAGWYPEYWEAIKALNTIGWTQLAKEMGDWWKWLPDMLNRYGKEWALDYVLEHAIG